MVMSFALPLSLILIPYAIFLAIFGFFAFFNVMQLLKDGTNEPKTTALVFVFLLTVVAILGATGLAASTVDWTGSVSLNLESSANTL